MKFEWEEIDNNTKRGGTTDWEATYRAKVIGGWIVRYELFYDFQYFDEESDHKDCSEEWMKKECSMVFVADPKHEWVVTEFDEVKE